MAANWRRPKAPAEWPAGHSKRLDRDWPYSSPTYPSHWAVSEVTDPCELTRETPERLERVAEARKVMEQHEEARQMHLFEVVDAARDRAKAALGEHKACGTDACCRNC